MKESSAVVASYPIVSEFGAPNMVRIWAGKDAAVWRLRPSMFDRFTSRGGFWLIAPDNPVTDNPRVSTAPKPGIANDMINGHNIAREEADYVARQVAWRAVDIHISAEATQHLARVCYVPERANDEPAHICVVERRYQQGVIATHIYRVTVAAREESGDLHSGGDVVYRAWLRSASVTDD